MCFRAPERSPRELTDSEEKFFPRYFTLTNIIIRYMKRTSYYSIYYIYIYIYIYDTYGKLHAKQKLNSGGHCSFALTHACVPCVVVPLRLESFCSAACICTNLVLMCVLP